LLVNAANARSVTRTRHYENETLYWTKAASILGLPQQHPVDSEVPIEPSRARADLIRLLQENLDPGYEPPDDDHELVFDGWRKLCFKFAPVFLEKSPHHLFQWSCIELILECIQTLRDVEFMLIGLVRNPMDTIYSQFSRWKTRPEKLEHQWFAAYTNLKKLKSILGDKLVIIRYEDIVISLDPLAPILNFCGAPKNVLYSGLHTRSLSKWKNDRLFGFSLSPEVLLLAHEYGYTPPELVNLHSPSMWPAYREISRLAYKSTAPLFNLARQLYPRSDRKSG
jgi:hypothetical protein